MANLGQGIGLIVFGLIFSLFGGGVYLACSSQPAVNGVAPNCTGPAIFLVFGVLFVVVGIVLVVVSVGRRTPMIQQVSDPSVPPPVIQPVVVQQTVEHDIVKVRCSYCGNLCDETAKACPSCGAPMGA
ncbi:MAG TPA: hypothetical protein VEJ85_00140 [Thermoplasmata archaeon]|nr:hypothetical protein [Thermoplasmata archaeon]